MLSLSVLLRGAVFGHAMTEQVSSLIGQFYPAVTPREATFIARIVTAFDGHFALQRIAQLR